MGTNSQNPWEAYKKGTYTPDSSNTKKKTDSQNASTNAWENYKKKTGFTVTTQSGSAQNWADSAREHLKETESYLSKWHAKEDSGYSSIKKKNAALLDESYYWLREYSNDPEAENYIKEIISALDNVRTSVKGYSDHYGKWGTEDEYNTARKNYDWQQKYKDFSIEDLQKLTLDDEEEQKWVKSYIQYLDDEEKGNYDLVAGQKEIDELKAQLAQMEQDNRYNDLQQRINPAKPTEPTRQDIGYNPHTMWQQGTVQTSGITEEEKLRQLIAQKQQYLNQAKHIQESNAYADTVNNADFDQFDDFVESDDTLYNWVNDAQFRDSYESKFQRNGTQSKYGFNNYDRIYENEIAIFNYYYAKGGKEAAQKYLDNIQETLNKRKAEEMFGVVKDDVALEMVFGAAAGVNQFGTNVANNFKFKADYIPQSAYQIASGMVREDLADNGKLPEWLGGNSLAQIAYDAVTTTANMAPSILVGMATGGTAGTALMGLSAAGGAYQQALNEGFDKAQARGYSILVGASEAVLEKVLGGISPVGGNAMGTNAVKNIANADNALKAIAKRIGGSLVSEFKEEYLQEVLDPLFRNLMMHTGEDVKLVSYEAIYSGILGALTGAFMEAPFAIYGETKTAITGRKIKEAGIVNDLAKIGNTFAPETVAYKLAGKVTNDTGAYTIGQLFNEVNARLTDQNISEIAEVLVENDVDERTARQYAEAFAYVVENGSMPDALANAIESDPLMAKAARKVLFEDNTTWNQRSQGYRDVLMKLAEDKVKGKTAPNSKASVPADNTAEAKTESGAEGNVEAVADGEKTASVKEIASLKNGVMKLRLDDGSEVDSGDASYGSDSEALVYETIAQMTNDVQVANILVNAFRSKKTALDADVFAAGLDEAFRYGTSNIPRKELATSEFASKLSVAQQDFAYRMGQRKAGQQVAKNKATVKNAQKSGKEKTAGKVHFDRKGRTFDKTREASLKTMEQLAALLGNEFYVYESYVNKDGKRVYKDADGNEVSAPNGFYDPETGAIHIDLNAGAEGNGTMIFAVAHELTHFIKHWSDDKFKVLANFLVKQYGEKDVSVSELVQKQIDKAKRNGRDLTWDEAYEEMVADSMESMLTDGNVVQMMADLKQQDKTLWQKICDWFKNLANDLKELVEAYKGYKPDSPEGKMVADMQDTIVILESIYADALAEASENFQMAEKNTTADGGVRMQTRSVNGEQVVWIEDNILNDNKGLPDHQFIAKYIAEHIGEVYTIIESGQKVYIGEDLPNEYTQSKYTQTILKRNPSISRAKKRASANFGEMIEIATNRRWERTKHTHSKDAKYGMYRYDTQFGFPVKNPRGDVIGANIYSAELLIRNASDGKKYLYDIVSIKKNTANSEWLTQRVTSAAGKPAGQKGDVSKNSIRNNGNNVNKKFSDRDPAAGRVNEVLQNENAKLKEDVQYLKDLVKIQKTVTGGTKFTKSSVEAMASNLMKANNVRGSKAELAKLLNELYEYIAKGEELSWDSVKEMAQPAVDWLRKNTVIKSELSQYAREILHDVRTSRISLDESQTAEAAYRFGSYNDFRKAMMGSVIVSKDGVPLDIQWQEWASMYPDIFDANITASDMPNALADAISSLRNSDLSRAEYAYHADMIEQDLLQQVYDGYWRVSTLYTVADVKQREINALNGKHRQKMNDLRQFHREKTDKLKQEHRDEVKRIRKEYREDSQKKQQEIIQRYQDSRKRSVENRNKTAMRHKIQNVVKELNSLLLSNDKKRHVPDNLKKAVADALDLLNMDTVDAENRAAKYANMIAAEQAKANPDQDKIDAYTVSMENILRKGEKMGQRIKELKDAYEEIQNSDDPDIANAYDPVIAGAIQELSATIGNTSIKNMSIEQLSDVYDVYRAVLTRVRDANKAMAENIKASIEELAKSTISEVQSVGGFNKYRISALDAVRKFDWDNLKPVYAMERIGSSTLTKVFNNVRAGEDVWARDISEARAYYLEKSKKYGYDKWDFEKKYRFESNSGIPFELTLEQMMSLYAYSKREQAGEHLRLGGFVFDSNIETTKEKDGKRSILKYKVNTADAHQITPEIMTYIIGKLTKEQALFVDEMQDYLSTVMGAKGNEVTSKMYGIKLFKEKFYFPLKSAKQFMFEQNEVSGEVRIKNSGFTNKVVTNANNPVILSNFMDVWSGHVNDMSMYHAFTLPLEDFNRVFNYNTPKKDGIDPVSVKGTIQNAYSPAAVQYVKNLITDLNGGARTDSTTGVINKLTGLFKKGAVFASLSVVVQQPSAIARASALIDTKYFIGPKIDQKRHKYLWDEVKQYAPVALIKEMGYFDTNMGKSTQDYITGKEYSGFSEQMKALVTDSNYRDEILSKAPAFADEVAWCSIWEAVKRETKAKHPSMDTKSEAFLKLAGQRFTEVITKTQVYDSVLARSANMRSKDTGMKMATAFMAEHTTSINMIEDAIMKGRRGDKRYARTAIGAVIASQILNSILVSFVYAARDDDEDETYLEKYIGSLAGGIIDGLNPATYIPFIKDIVSIVKGYDVERSDMAVVSDLWNAWKSLSNENVSMYRKVEGFAGSIAQIFGLPVKNIMRDVRGIYNAIMTITGAEKATGAGVKYAIGEAITGKTISNKEQLYEARMAGDASHAARVEARYDDMDSADAAVRAAIKDEFMADKIDEATALDRMVRYAGMDGSEAHWTMDAWKYRKAVGSDDGYGKYGRFYDAVRSGNNLLDVIKEYTDNGVKESTLAGQITEEFKPVYVEALAADRAGMKSKLVDAFVACGMDRDDAEGKLESWDFEAEYGFAYSDRKEAYLTGKVSRAVLTDILIDRGYEEDDADAQIDAYEWEAEGFEDITTSAVRNYNTYAEPAGIPKSVFIGFWEFDNSTENDVDPTTGKKIAYSAVKKIMAYINSLNLTDSQKDALAKSAGWADKTIQKYKLW